MFTRTLEKRSVPAFAVLLAVLIAASRADAEIITEFNLSSDPLAHRKSPIAVRLVDSVGQPVAGAAIDVKMTRHAFRFGTNVRDRLFSISEPEFNALNTTGRQNLLPNLTSFGQPTRYTPTWQDVVKHREVVYEQFNNVVPTTGMQWVQQQNQGYAVIDTAINQALAGGLTVTGASVVWQVDGFPTPTQYRSTANPDPQQFHAALVNERLGPNGVLARFSDAGVGPNVIDWKLLNEPLHQSYYNNVFVNGGIYPDAVTAMADYFKRADAVRPDASLSINDFNIFNWDDDSKANQYRDLVNALLAQGAPIDRIGIQSHIARNNVFKADMLRRLDILAQTGLPIEISEFDTRDDPATPFTVLTPAEQERVFNDVLTAAFEHPAVDGFTMWGVWDPAHWRANGVLFDQAWNIKDEASPWFDLVRGAWMPNLTGLSVDGLGMWSATDGLFDGDYRVTAHYGGQSFVANNVKVGLGGEYLFALPISVPEPSSILILLVAAITIHAFARISVAPVEKMRND